MEGGTTEVEPPTAAGKTSFQPGPVGQWASNDRFYSFPQGSVKVGGGVAYVTRRAGAEDICRRLLGGRGMI